MAKTNISVHLMVEVLKETEKQRNKYTWLELHMEKTVLCTGLNSYARLYLGRFYRDHSGRAKIRLKWTRAK